MRGAVVTFLWLSLSVSSSTIGQSNEKTAFPSTIQQYRKAHAHQILQEYFELLSIPNVSSDSLNVRKNAEYIQTMMKKRGIDTRIMETQGNPVVYGEIKVEGARNTLAFYLHYDGQPVDPSEWIDTHPFHPVLRPGKLEQATGIPQPIPFPEKEDYVDEEWRIYARSASDDKAPVMGILCALDALKDSNILLKNNLKFIFEGEEEAGSTHLRPFLEKHRKMLNADILFMCDGPVYFSGDPTLFFGVRGITTLQVTVYGPNTNLHSGHFGNWAPNPAMRLAQLLATMKDSDGHVLIKNFYDTCIPLNAFEVKVLEAVPSCEEALMKLYGFSGPENRASGLLKAIQLPSLNVNGIRSGWIDDQARTIVPAYATVSIDIRLVKGNDPVDMVQKVVDHIESQGYHVVEKDPDHHTRMKYPLLARVTRTEKGYRASRIPMDSPIATRIIDALSEIHNTNLVLLPSLGGSLPFYMFEDVLNIPIIGVPIVNHDNNQHQPNENLRIGHLWKGIETFAALFLID